MGWLAQMDPNWAIFSKIGCLFEVHFKMELLSNVLCTTSKPYKTAAPYRFKREKQYFFKHSRKIKMFFILLGREHFANYFQWSCCPRICKFFFRIVLKCSFKRSNKFKISNLPMVTVTVIWSRGHSFSTYETISENWHFSPSDAHTYACLSGECFFWKILRTY